MSNFSYHKNQNGRSISMVSKPYQHEINKAPRQFCDYMNGVDNRFSEIARLYLDGMSMDDVRHLRADDFISLVPKDQYRHKMLMTIMVRRYLYKHDESCTCSCTKNNTHASTSCISTLHDNVSMCHCNACESNEFECDSDIKSNDNI